MTAAKSPSSRVRRAFFGVFVVGAALVVTYYLFAALHVGKVGQPTDIGGGAMALLGYAAAAVGVLGFLVTVFVERRGSPRAGNR